MINTTLRKCLGELEKPEPNISYVRGMLETLIEMNDSNKPARETIEQAAKNLPNTIGTLRAASHFEETSNEGAILEARARAAVESIKAMSEASSHE